MSAVTRRQWLARVHCAAKSIGLAGDDYRAWLKRRTGKDSCAELTDAQLEDLVRSLKATRPQWRKVAKLVREIGLSGIQDPAFHAFVMRTTKEGDPHLLNALQLRNLIAGLIAWRNNLAKRGRLPATPGSQP